MAKFRVTFIVGSANGDSQIIEAHDYSITANWINFGDQFTTAASIAANTVTRIERIEG